jgi:hypothetical protein
MGALTIILLDVTVSVLSAKQAGAVRDAGKLRPDKEDIFGGKVAWNALEVTKGCGPTGRCELT